MAKTHNVCRAWEGLSAAIAALVAPFAWGETLMVTTPTTVTTAATYAHRASEVAARVAGCPDLSREGAWAGQ